MLCQPNIHSAAVVNYLVFLSGTTCLLSTAALSLAHMSTPMKTAIHCQHTILTCSQSTVNLYRRLTNSQIRDIKLPQLNLLSITEPAPAEVVRNARRRRHGRLHGIDEELDGHFGIVCGRQRLLAFLAGRRASDYTHLSSAPQRPRQTVAGGRRPPSTHTSQTTPAG